MAGLFDLRERRWLPVSGGDMVGLRELFRRAHEFEDLRIPVPPAASGLWRVLYAITARITKLDDPTMSADEWMDRRDAIVASGRFDPEAVAGYLDRFTNRFDLFDEERPWMQDPRLRTECPKSSGINKLVMGRPSGNNQVWFEHFSSARQVPLPAHEAAWWLVTQLYYGPSGQCATRTVDGQSFTNMKAGPLRSVLSFHPIGRNLFESLVAGLPGPTLASGMQGVDDRCPWEWEELPDPLKAPPAPGWPAGMLTDFRHAVLLRPDAAGEQAVDAYLTWGWRPESVPAPNPYVLQRQSKKGSWYSPRADSSRALWRDLDSLLCFSGETTRRPQVVEDCSDLPYVRSIRLRALGFDQDGQTRDLQWFSAITPPVLQWLETADDHTAAIGIRTLREAAESIAGSLRFALDTAWDQAAKTSRERRDRPWSRRAVRTFWSEAEHEFWRRVTARDFRSARVSFGHIALDQIEAVTLQRQHQPRVAKAVSGARAIVRKQMRGTVADEHGAQ